MSSNYTGYVVQFLLAVSTLVAIPFFYIQHHQAIAGEAQRLAMTTNQAIEDLMAFQRRLESERNERGGDPDVANARLAAIEREFLVLRGRDELIPKARACLYLLFSRIQQAEAGTLPEGVDQFGQRLSSSALIALQAQTLHAAVDGWKRERTAWTNVFGRFANPTSNAVFDACAQDTAPELGRIDVLRAIGFDG